ncbi:SpoIIE family protein phosphatase, partial [Myxococcota bacterium]|nr:SpoIIE family protein phosphatase [Myxococcota bacterium]
ALYKAFEIIGRPFPTWLVTQLLVLVGSWVVALFLRATGLFYGSAKGEERERRKILSQLNYAGSMIALFQGRPVLMVEFIVRDLLNVHFLGATAETAVTFSVYGAVLGTFQLRKVMDRYVRLGTELAQQIGDPAALAVCRAYEAVGRKWAGDLVEGNELLLAALPGLHRHVPGSWYAAMMICEQAYSFLHAGRSREAIEHARGNASQLERTNNLMFRYNTLSVQYAEMMLSGAVTEATELWAKLEPQYVPLSKTIYVGLARCIAQLEVMVDQEETGPMVDETVEQFNGLLSEDYYSNAARMLVGYARLAQFEAAKGEAKVRARRRFEAAIRSLAIRALVPVFKCHVLVWKAVLARTDHRYDRAFRLLDRADRLASRSGSDRGAYYVALERARCARDAGSSSSCFLAEAAVAVATSQSWRLKARRVRAEFGLDELRTHTISAVTTVGKSTNGHSNDQSRRFTDALLQVSLASASTLDPEELAKNALNEVARVLGAERALFYLVEANGELELKARTGVGAENASRTVVRRVLETRAPVVLTGTDEGEALGSQSIVAYGLRSIIAAPLMLRDRLVGIVYLDSRLAKGIFTQEDVALLLGVSNHIAIAIETARMARLEAERSALRRDFEILGAVQSLLLPKTKSFFGQGLRGAGFYQPAAQCGGDWWWYEALDDGSVLLLLGDVSGHGAGSAMITSAVAGAYHTMRAAREDATPTEILEEIDRRLRAFGGNFHMTMSIVLVDATRQRLSWWNAAGPSVFVQRAGGCEVLSLRGHVLGDPSPFEVGELVVPFLPGDRLLLCTDGVLELKRGDGRQLGARRFSQIFAKHASTPFDELADRLGGELNGILDGRLQDDDITFIALEATPGSAIAADVREV